MARGFQPRTEVSGQQSYARMRGFTTRRRGREVEGTPLLREHTAYTRIEGSNPSISARIKQKTL